MNEDLINIIGSVARIPSFSSYEERLHPFIRSFVAKNGIKCTIDQHYNNLIIKHDNGSQPLMAFTAHLDKIDHFGNDIDELPFKVENEQIVGQLDNAVGIGICLYLLSNAREFNLPGTLFLFSEMEESHGLRKNKERLKNQGAGLAPQIGAKRISEYLIKKALIPSVIITIDTTPLFYGTKGIALYSRFWENYASNPSAELLAKTSAIEDIIEEIDPGIIKANNVNDYVMFGKTFNDFGYHIPSIALEPSIYPYHTIGERVFVSDLNALLHIIKRFVVMYSENHETSVHS